MLKKRFFFIFICRFFLFSFESKEGNENEEKLLTRNETFSYSLIIHCWLHMRFFLDWNWTSSFSMSFYSVFLVFFSVNWNWKKIQYPGVVCENDILFNRTFEGFCQNYSSWRRLQSLWKILNFIEYGPVMTLCLKERKSNFAAHKTCAGKVQVCPAIEFLNGSPNKYHQYSIKR